MKNHRNEHTRERILDEAEALFALKGYHAVSIREITGAARCNLAAVNYHFGNKQNLYLEVYRQRWLPRAERVRQSFQNSIKTTPVPSADTVVHSLARAFLDGPLSNEARRRHLRLIVGELCQPTEAFELVVERVFRPLLGSLIADLRTAMPVDVDEEQAILNAFSIMAMVLYFNLSHPLIKSVLGTSSDNDLKTRLVDHLVEFSLNGIAGGNRGSDK